MIKLPLKTVFLGTLAFAGLSPVLGEEMRFGGAIVDLPDGWQQEKSEFGIMLSRNFEETENAEKAAAMIQILHVADKPEGLGTNIASMVGWVDGMAEEDPMTDSAGTTVNGHPIQVEYRCCGEAEVSLSQTVAGVAGENEQLLASLIFVNSSSDHQEEADEVFAGLVRSIRFEGDGDAGMTTQDGDGGLEGIYTHLATGLMPNAFGGVDFTSESEIVVFDEAGLFSDTLPAGGDLAAHCAANPIDCGTYKVSGGGFWSNNGQEIEMRSMVDEYGVVETETQPLERSGDDLKIGDSDYYAVPPFDTGTKLDGSWTYTWASSGMTASSSGSVATQQTLVLTPDGRFTRDGWSGGSSSGDMGGVSVSNDRRGERGTYEIADYELILTGDDGRAQTLSIFAPDRDSDELLVIDGSNFLKDD